MKYHPGDFVYYGEKKGTVLKCINNDNPLDVRTQGYRYYVDVNGETWSVLERDLEKRLFSVIHGSMKTSSYKG